MKQRGRIPKPLLYDIVAEARACGMGPRRLGDLIGYNYQHMSRIAMELGFPKRERWAGGVRWSARLVELIQATGQSVDKDCLHRCENCGSIIGGTVRPQETQAA